MRSAFLETKFLYDKDILYGINLGFDFCAEHEFGIDGLLKAFSILKNSNLIGVDRRIIRENNPYLSFLKTNHKGKNFYILTLCWNPAWYEYTIDGNLKYRQLGIFDFNKYSFELLNKNGVVASWDSNSFAIMTDLRHKKDLQLLYESFKNKDVLFYFQKNENPFSRAGLHIGIVSNLPKFVSDGLKDADLELLELEKQVFDSGIIQFLEENGKGYREGYYDLNYKFDSDKNLRFYVNPVDYKYKSGWYNLQDLKDWVEEKGNLIKK